MLSYYLFLTPKESCMSYPSIHQHLESQGATLESASEAQLRQAFISAFKSDLPLGFARVSELVEKLRAKQHRVMLTLDPKSQEGRSLRVCWRPIFRARCSRITSIAPSAFITAATALPRMTGAA
jgi:hypothetical protein